MPKNTYNNLKLALEEKGYWTPLDERRTDKDVVVESVRKEQEREGAQGQQGISTMEEYELEIAELTRKVEFYKRRADMLQCWQSSMRDPERKIVCDILANGFTLTTKEDIKQAQPQDAAGKENPHKCRCARDNPNDVFKDFCIHPIGKEWGGYCIGADHCSRYKPPASPVKAVDVLAELADFLDNPDNTCDFGNARKGVMLPTLFKWMQSKGWQP